jgi:hypothetical protein
MLILPLELFTEWLSEAMVEHGSKPGTVASLVAEKAAQWGSNMELEACCKWLKDFPHFTGIEEQLRAARRPKPPSLKQQALEAMREMQIEPCILDGVNTNAKLQAKYDTIIRALESMPDA